MFGFQEVYRFRSRRLILCGGLLWGGTAPPSWGRRPTVSEKVIEAYHFMCKLPRIHTSRTQCSGIEVLLTQELKHTLFMACRVWIQNMQALLRNWKAGVLFVEVCALSGGRGVPLCRSHCADETKVATSGACRIILFVDWNFVQVSEMLKSYVQIFTKI